MPRKKSKPKLPETVKCPVYGHSHELAFVPHPELPDELRVAYCGERIVVSRPIAHHPEPTKPADWHYVVPTSDGD